MILGLSVKNYKAFNNEVSISFLANQKLGHKTVISANKYQILRSCVLYGANNSGKTNFLSSVFVFKSIFLHDRIEKKVMNEITNFLHANLEDSFPIEFEIQYYDRGCKKEYSYGVLIHQDGEVEDYLFQEDVLIYSKTNNPETMEYSKDLMKDQFNISLLERTSKESLFVNNVLRNQQTMSDQQKETCPFFSVKRMFDSIHYYGKNDLMTDVTSKYKRLKEILENPKLNEIYNMILEKADISLSKHIVVKNNDDYSALSESIPENNASKKMFRDLTDLLSIQSSIQTEYHRYDDSSITVPSYQFDSGGTSSFAFLIVDILFAIEKNEFLMIDEIDRSLHYRLSSELISFINNIPTSDSQFLLTAHDVKLLDPSVFRKDQIYFVDRNHLATEVYSLNDFVSNSKTTTDIRSTTKFENPYVKGNLGALPDPDFYEVAKKFDDYGESNG